MGYGRYSAFSCTGTEYSRKTEAVFRLFRPAHPVVAVSARTGWELDTLVSALMTALPDHAASP